MQTLTPQESVEYLADIKRVVHYDKHETLYALSVGGLKVTAESSNLHGSCFRGTLKFTLLDEGEFEQGATP